MKALIFISFICLVFISCGKSESIENRQLIEDMSLNRAHNANIIRQVSNDKIIMGTTLGRQMELLPTQFKLDGLHITEDQFITMPLDSLYYVEKRINTTQDLEDSILKQQNIYKAYSSKYYKQHAFTPVHFDLLLDEHDLLQLDIKHPADGDFYAYGFDKKTGKKGIENYVDLDYTGHYSSANRLLDRKIDELRIVVTLADSIYIHDYVIEDFYTHDH